MQIPGSYTRNSKHIRRLFQQSDILSFLFIPLPCRYMHSNDFKFSLEIHLNYSIDHMQGLDSPSLSQYLQSKPGRFIYSSKATKSILLNWPKYEPLARYIKVMDMNHPTQIEMKNGNQSSNEESSFIVTLIPSGHCVGSIMYNYFDTKILVLFILILPI